VLAVSTGAGSRQRCAGSKDWWLAACNSVLWHYALELADRKGADCETEKETTALEQFLKHPSVLKTEQFTKSSLFLFH
jgi:hypothetical protein